MTVTGVELETFTRPRESVEYLAVNWDYYANAATGEAIDPPDDYEITAVPIGERPTEDDWHTAPWLAGPFVAGLYVVYIRFNPLPEQVVRDVFYLKAT